MQKLTLEEYLQQLEGVVLKMEDPATNLDASIELFKSGLQLAYDISTEINTLETEVLQLSEQAGELVKTNFGRE